MESVFAEWIEPENVGRDVHEPVLSEKMNNSMHVRALDSSHGVLGPQENGFSLLAGLGHNQKRCQCHTQQHKHRKDPSEAG